MTCHHVDDDGIHYLDIIINVLIIIGIIIDVDVSFHRGGPGGGRNSGPGYMKGNI